MNLKSLIPVGRDRGVALSGGNPFSSLQREVDRLFGDFARGFPTFDFGSGGRGVVPSIDISETDTEIQIAAELPGIEEKDIQIDVSGNMLTIRGEKKSETETKDKSYHLVERSYGSFKRAFTLPDNVDAEKIAAKFDKGVLKVTLPKKTPSASKQREIPIKG